MLGENRFLPTNYYQLKGRKRALIYDILETKGDKNLKICASESSDSGDRSGAIFAISAPKVNTEILFFISLRE